jgi:hypothetical protein
VQPQLKQPPQEAIKKPKVNESCQTPSPESKILEEAQETRSEKHLEKLKGENPPGGIFNISV